jgi:hypothetical protein
MSKQYLLQTSDGARNPMPWAKALELKTRFKLVTVLETDQVIVLAHKSAAHARPEQPLNFGGGRLKNPYQTLASYRNTREVQAKHW